MAMNKVDQGLLIAFYVLGLYAMCLWFFMILRVNRNLPPSRWVSLLPSGDWWKRLLVEYKGFYPRSTLPRLMRSCAVLILIVAAALLGLRVWEYTKGIL